VLRKQRVTIESLTRDNKRLAQDLSLHQAIPRDVEHRLAADRRNNALGEIRILMDEIRKAEAQTGATEHSISILRRRLASNKGSPRPLTCEEVDSRIEALETRLHNSIVKFNETVACNAELRTSVDSLRQDKSHFAELEAKAVEDINEVKHRSLKLMEEINSNYAAKDKAIADLQHLRGLADREHFEFDEQSRSLMKLLEVDLEHHRPKDFAAVFEQVRPQSVPEEQPPDATPILHKLNADLSTARDKLSNLKSIFERIKGATGFTNIDDLVAWLNSIETLNYSLFTRSDFLLTEVNKAQALRDHYHGSLVECTKAMISDTNHAHANVLEENLEKIRKVDEKIFVKDSRISKLANHIHSILQTLSGNNNFVSYRTTFTDLLESSENSVQHYLARIDSLLDRFVGPSFKQPSKLRPRRSLGNVNWLSLPSSMRLDNIENQLSGEKLLSRDEIMKLASAAPIRAVSAASTRPSTNHKISRKSSVIAQINDSL